MLPAGVEDATLEHSHQIAIWSAKSIRPISKEKGGVLFNHYCAVALHIHSTLDTVVEAEQGKPAGDYIKNAIQTYKL